MTETDEEFAEHVTYLNEMARRCAEETVYRAELCGEDRNTVLRAVIGRLKDAIGMTNLRQTESETESLQSRTTE